MVIEAETETPLTKDLETTINGNGFSVINSANEEMRKLNSDSNDNVEIIIEKDDPKSQLEKQYFTIPIYKSLKISVYKPFLQLRIALFLWYGAGNIPMAYMSVFMKQKGLTLAEFSWIFSVAFVFQFLFAFVSGVIADKIGNAKPVLMTHILVTVLCVLSLLFSPKVNMGGESVGSIKYYSKELLNSSRFSDTYSDSINLPCRVLSENCTDLNHKGWQDVNAPPNVIVFVYFILLTTFLSSWSTVYNFMDVTVMSFSKKHDVSFGHERLFAMSGYTLMTFLICVALNQLTPLGEENNYQSIYGFSAVIIFLSLVASYCIKSQVKPPSKHILKDGFRFMKNQDVVVFIILVFLLGTSFGFIDNFGWSFLEHLNAPRIVFGLHRTLNGFYGLPFLFTSKWWLKRFGPRILFVIAFFGYIIFGLGFSFLYNPWLVLLLEVCSVLTYHLLWVAVIVHAHNIAPEGLVSTIIAIAGATHYGLGRGVGNLCYGLGADALGPRTTFRIFAGMNFLYAVCYILFMFTRKTRVVRREFI